MTTLKTVLGINTIYDHLTTKYLNIVGLPRPMEEQWFPTGSPVFDALLRGYEEGILTAVYGPAGTGKTTVCMLAALATIKAGKKVIFVDTETGFSTVRFKQLLQTENADEYLEKIFLLKPATFNDQMRTIARLKDLANEKIGLIVVDSISMLYRIEMGKHEGVKAINADLGLQLYYLNAIARKYNIPVLVTSQVYADFEEREKVKVVGGDILKYGSKCIIAIEKYKSHRKAIIVKHRSLPEEKAVVFKIEEQGFTLIPEMSTSDEQHTKKTKTEAFREKYPEFKGKEGFENVGE